MKMIRREIREVLSARNLSGRVDVEIFVPEGERLARNTLNARLGIVGGISILGTTGVVRPMSHDAYESTIRSHLSVAGAMGLSRVVFTTGRRSERFAQELFTDVPEEGFVQIGDFFKAAMTMAAEAGINGVILTVFFGKAVKMASGFPHTHAAKSSLTLDRLAQWAGDVDGGRSLSEAIRSANTARHAFDIVNGRCNGIIREVGRRMTASADRFADGAVSVRGVILDYSGEVCFDSRRPR
jgi:cobalt-precorrin-5B (C1)-methyltransferase